MQKTFILFLVLVQSGYSGDYYYKDYQKVSLKPLSKQSNEVTQIRYYKNTDDVTMGITDKILIKLSTKETIEPYLTKYHLRQIKQLGNALYLVTTDSAEKTLDTANALHREQSVLYAHPDFVKQRVLR